MKSIINISKKTLILFVFLFTVSISAFSQGNTPCTAVAISANATCVNTAGTTASLTYNNNAANGGTPSCATPGAADGWYSFTPTVTATYTIDLTAGTITDSGMSISTAASGCTDPTQLLCDDDGGTGTMSQIVTSLTSGVTYYIRIWKYSSGTGTFSICITQGAPPPPPPANDAPCSATPVTVNSAANTCTTQTGGTVVGATASGVALGACFGTADDDVWYSFVANNATQNISLNNLAGSTTDMYFSVYSGACGALGAALLCSDPQSNTITGLTVGNTYFIRIYTYTGTTGQTSTFSVCINPPPPPPANDNPCSATPATVNSAFTCTTQTGGTVVGATASGVALGACFGTPDDDVWYSFVANNTTQNISLNSLAGSTTDLYFSVYSGACGALSAALLCSDPESNTITGLTVGNTYYIRIYSYTSTTGQTSTFSICINPPPTPPANDNPCSATPVAVNTAANTCTTQTGGTVVGATASGVALGACFGTPDDDVWYSFVANNTTQNISLNNLAGSTTDMYFSVYSGACGALGAALLCSDPQSNTITGLTVGNTYFIRIYTYTGTTGQTSTFSVCINPPPPPPANDNPCSATPATVNSAFTCTTQTGGTVVGATASGVALGACFGTPDDDVWYSFVANNTTQNISLNNLAGSTTDMYFSVYSGACGALGAALLCSDPQSNTITGLTVGNTYFIRIYTYTGTTGQNTTFSLCITPPPPVPVNDAPCSATSVPVNSAFTCTTQTGGTVAGATASGIALGACFGTADDDVWFKFVANNTTQLISLNNLAGSTTDMYFSVYSGACGALGAALLCSDPENNIISGLTVGNTYIIRIYSYTGTTGQTSTFSICITPPPTPPSNDNPCSAIAAPVNSAPGTCTVQTAGTIAGATASGIALGACGGTADDDVWYSFVANSTSMNINLNNISGSTTDLYHSVYSGACGTLGAALICSDPNSSSLTGLTVGATYIIRIYSFTSTAGQTSTFSLCINPTPPPPVNVTCNQMQPICSGSPIIFQAQAGGGSAAVGPNYGCLSTTPNPTWFYMEILTSGTMAVDLTAGSDVDFALWGPYASLAVAQANCTTYPAPLDCSYSSSAVEQMNIPAVIAGEVYAVLVTNYASVIQSITLNQAGGASATTNCAIILPVGLLYFNAIPDDNIVNISWETASELNNDYFEVERSIDGVKWEVLTRKEGMGTIQSKTSYNSRDTKPYSGVSYYRLKQVDFNQSFIYSNIVSVDLNKGKEQVTNIHPNPTNGNIEFEVISKTKNQILIELIDNTGNVISSQQNGIEEGSNSVKLNLEKFDSGIYLLKVSFENTGKSVIQKVIKH